MVVSMSVGSMVSLMFCFSCRLSFGVLLYFAMVFSVAGFVFCLAVGAGYVDVFAFGGPGVFAFLAGEVSSYFFHLTTTTTTII